MTRMGRYFVIASVLAASAVAAPLARGTRFATIGLDYRVSGGSIYSLLDDSSFAGIDPLFRVSIHVGPGLALGADLALLNAFPTNRDALLNTPVFAFGPTATWLPAPFGRLQVYGTGGAAVAYRFGTDVAGRVRLGAGLLYDAGLPVSFGLEAGGYADFLRTQTIVGFYPYQVEWTWVSGQTLFVGLRLSDLRL